MEDEPEHMTKPSKPYRYFPYFKANGWRGRLRRAAAAALMDKFLADGDGVSMACYNGMTCGAVSAKPEGVRTVAEIKAAHGNAYMGLFGGGPRILESAWRVGDLLPVVDPYLELGAIPARFRSHRVRCEHGSDLTDIVTFNRRDDVLDMVDVRAGKIIFSYRAEVEALQAATLANRAARKENKNRDVTEKKVKKTDLRNHCAYEVVAPGTPLYFYLQFQPRADDPHVGLMLEALANVINQQSLGGKIGAGCGRFTADLDLYEGETRLASAMDYKKGIAIPADNSHTRPYVDAASAAIDALTAADMAAFYGSVFNDAAA
jgi:CRISPR type IV-associated protein Csf2